MLQSDKLKISILDLLEKNKALKLGELKKRLNVSHHYTIVNALKFLRYLNLISITELNDARGSKIVRLTGTYKLIKINP